MTIRFCFVREFSISFAAFAALSVTVRMWWSNVVKQLLAVEACSEWLHTRSVAMSSERNRVFSCMHLQVGHAMEVKSYGNFRLSHDVSCIFSTGNGPMAIQFLCF